MVTLNQFGSAALAIVIAAIMISIGATIQTDMAKSSTLCTGTWVTNTSGVPGEEVNPLDGSYVGCCQTVNTTHPTVCGTWLTSSVGLNATYKGLDANETFATWLPIIAVVVAAVVVIGLLVTYLGGLGSRM